MQEDGFILGGGSGDDGVYDYPSPSTRNRQRLLSSTGPFGRGVVGRGWSRHLFERRMPALYFSVVSSKKSKTRPTAADAADNKRLPAFHLERTRICVYD